ncbi:hypothetical protein GCM10029963_24180 [Micromonospora andamanensis]
MGGTEPFEAAPIGDLRSRHRQIRFGTQMLTHRQLVAQQSGHPVAGVPGRAAVASKAAAEAGIPVSDACPPGGDAWSGEGSATGRANEVRYCIFTSGTTGRPKGATVEHQGMLNHLWAKVADLDLSGADRLAFTAPLVFDISIWQMLAPLLCGGTVEVVRPEDLAYPRRLTTRLESAGVTVVELVPTVAGWIAREAERRGRPSCRSCVGSSPPVRNCRHSWRSGCSAPCRTCVSSTPTGPPSAPTTSRTTR